ncbi:hypothetical protein B0H12DRAFT_1108804 [Mycena haematopus]|nr:hypothetical protein B0H12DRAFT_1108804 [Mycena haematopus]
MGGCRMTRCCRIRRIGRTLTNMSRKTGVFFPALLACIRRAPSLIQPSCAQEEDCLPSIPDPRAPLVHSIATRPSAASARRRAAGMRLGMSRVESRITVRSGTGPGSGNLHWRCVGICKGELISRK